jgi:hypothetical protein
LSELVFRGRRLTSDVEAADWRNWVRELRPRIDVTAFVGSIGSVPDMSMNASGRAILPYGSWPTPITSAVIVASAVRISEVRADNGDVVWSEGRPAEGGRTQLVRRWADGTVVDLLGDGQNAPDRDPRIRRCCVVDGGRCRVVRRLGESAAVPS